MIATDTFMPPSVTSSRLELSCPSIVIRRGRRGSGVPYKTSYMSPTVLTYTCNTFQYLHSIDLKIDTHGNRLCGTLNVLSGNIANPWGCLKS
jgi:hypothetical protein